MLSVAILDSTKVKAKWAEVEGRWKLFPCHEAQLDILASKCKYTAAFFGTGSGKTAMLPLKIYKELERYRAEGNTDFWRCLVVSPSEPTFLSSQLLQHIQTVFDDTLFTGKWNSKTKTYTGLAFEIVVRTAQNDPRRLSGGQYNLIIFDEAWQVSNPEVWAEVRRRSNIKDCQVVVATTPNVDGWLYDEVYQKWEAKDPNYYVRQASTSENPAKTKEEHARFLNDELIKLGQARFDRMYGGQFSQISGLVYDCFGNDKKPDWPVIKTLARLPRPAVKVFGSVDFGYFPDPFTAHIYVETDDGIVYCVEEIYETKLEIDYIGAQLRYLQDKWSVNFESPYKDVLKGGFFESYYCDSSRPEVRQLISRFGVTIQNRKVSDISAGVAITDQVFRTGRLRIFDCCPNLVREARSYAWDKNKPRAGNDHAMDSLRYGISSYFDGKQITVIPEQARVTDIETAMMLGMAVDQKELEIAKAKAEAQKLRDWLIKLQWLDSD